mmetsp:Transcript_12024/g.18108  ORF Transcript_12024/g.18108 Transcript_12024/m.18108 type:complete len:488 (+) Transcript_12024:209-1672(+)
MSSTNSVAGAASNFSVRAAVLDDAARPFAQIGCCDGHGRLLERTSPCCLLGADVDTDAFGSSYDTGQDDEDLHRCPDSPMFDITGLSSDDEMVCGENLQAAKKGTFSILHVASTKRKTKGNNNSNPYIISQKKTRFHRRKHCMMHSVLRQTSSEMNSIASMQSLSSDVLLNIIMHTDIMDLPSVAAVNKHWNKILRYAENTTLWHVLVRRYHPLLEDLFAPGDAMANALNSGQSRTQGLLFPSSEWKQLFRKRHNSLREAEARTIDHEYEVENSFPPRPLSKYVFLVDFTCFQRDDYHPHEARKVKIISRMFPGSSIKFNCLDRIEFKFQKDFGLELSEIEFDYFDVTIHIIDGNFGRQALLYHGHTNWIVDRGATYFEQFSNFKGSWNNRRFQREWPSSQITLEKPGCACFDEDDIFHPCNDTRCMCRVCRCRKKRKSRRYVSSFLLNLWMSWDFLYGVTHPGSIDADDMSIYEQLQFFERGLLYE